MSRMDASCSLPLQQISPLRRRRPGPVLPAQPSTTSGSARRRRGFTILEVALAAAIMAMGIATSITVMQRGFQMLDTARNLTTAGQIMISQMEQVRMVDWGTVSAYPSAATAVTLDTVFSSNSAVTNRFTVTRTVDTLSATLLQITFTVAWTSIDGRRLSRSMTSYYARYGIHDYIYNGPTS
jgi:Tfp pilus assembly protein PilV